MNIPLVRVISVAPLPNYRLQVALSNGKSGVFDVAPYFRGDFFSELQDAAYFSRVSLVSGKSGIEWPNGQDLSAYTLEAGLRPTDNDAAANVAARISRTKLKTAHRPAAKSIASAKRASENLQRRTA